MPRKLAAYLVFRELIADKAIRGPLKKDREYIMYLTQLICHEVGKEMLAAIEAEEPICDFILKNFMQEGFKRFAFKQMHLDNRQAKILAQDECDISSQAAQDAEL